ncbi:hypothetical protein [Paenibacillus naphthalenovorans]|uniref:hypothetical protein n=1 Tax=Paenibacillus naphthalenovorans TaxID=162209 RepID=UPI003D29C882
MKQSLKPHAIFLKIVHGVRLIMPYPNLPLFARTVFSPNRPMGKQKNKPSLRPTAKTACFTTLE